MNIAFLGYGKVGAPLADRLQRLGHTVTLAAREGASKSLQTALTRNPNLLLAGPAQAVGDAQVVFLAIPFREVESTLTGLQEELRGKILVDCTNPVGPNLTHGLNNTRSGTEMIQALTPETQVVKAFTIYGFENFENPDYPGYNVRPAMLFCGDDPAAKRVVAGLLDELGWEPVDVGGAGQALHLEHMTLLWVRMVRVHGVPPGLVWAALRR